MSFVFILLGIYYLIFFVVLILSINCKFVISFFNVFFCVLIFRVLMVLVIFFISSSFFYFISSSSSYFFSNNISDCLFLISRTFIAFCYSISINALLNCILSLKFSKICSFILFISSFSSIFPHMQTNPSFLRLLTDEPLFVPKIFVWLSFSLMRILSLKFDFYNLIFNSSISPLKSLMIFLYSLIWIETNFLLVNAFVFIFLALFAYFNVFIVYSNWELAGLIFTIITVLQFPPRESFSNLVSLESRYGTKNPFLFLSPKAFIQFASASKDLLIFAPSINRIPLFSVTVPLSDPAKSISDNLPLRV